MTASISLGVICLFQILRFFLLQFWMIVRFLCLSILSRLSNLLAYSCSYYFLTVFCISFVSVVISPLSFMILFIWLLPLFFLMSLVKVLSVLFIFSKNQLLDSLIFCIIFRLYLVYFFPDLYYFHPSTHFMLCLLFFLKFLSV